MLKLSIIDILKNNTFGAVTGGLSQQEIVDILGEPDDFEANEGESYYNAKIWKYAGIEFHFALQEKNKLTLFLIWNDTFEFLSDQSSSKKVKLDLDFIGRNNLIYKDLLNYFKLINLKYKVFRSKLSGSYFLHFESGAGLFLEEYDEETKPLMSSEVIAIQAIVPFQNGSYEEII